jgi:hypothetical protein
MKSKSAAWGLVLLGAGALGVQGQTQAVNQANAVTTQHVQAVTARLWGGPGPLLGRATVQIGGNYDSSEGSGSIGYFPMSELIYPLNVAAVTVGGEVTLAALECHGRLMKTVTQDSYGTAQDSDWENADDPDMKTTYSECDAELDAWSIDGGIRYWVLNTRHLDAALGIGCFYERLDWDISDLDQWYPQEPELGHDYAEGLVATYEAEALLPYLDVATRLRAGRFTGTLGVGVIPYGTYRDKDDHLLRSKKMEGSADGWGVKGEGEARLQLVQGLFVQLSGDVLYFTGDGTQKQTFYAGEDEGYWAEIDYKAFTTQVNIRGGIGWQF